VKKVLIITYYWPPSGGPGVQRVLKFAKYLPDFGWEPVILTVENGEYPAIDKTLFSEIPEICTVYKTKSATPSALYKKFTGMKNKKDDSIPVSTLVQKNITWKQKLSNFIRLNFFIPDAKIGWIPYAVKAGKKIIEKEQPDIIFSTSPPPTVHLIAAKLAKWSGIKWVADFRDPWTKIHYLQQQRINPVSKKINKNLEKKVIKNCNAAICVSNNFINLLTQTDKMKFTVITNGFDNEINRSTALKNTSKFTILYIGGLAWTRYYPDFILLIAKLFENRKLNPGFIEFQFVGSIEKGILEDIKEKLKHVPNTKYINYVTHEKALEFMHKANLLLLFLEKGENYEGHIPGKLFEYLSTGNQILCIGNKKGDTAKIINENNAGKIFESAEIDKIEEEIISQFNHWNNKIPQEREINTEILNKYTRKRLTQKLAKLFDSLQSPLNN
jgi:glycosyltransferase involved in cell wall biosynthesis